MNRTAYNTISKVVTAAHIALYRKSGGRAGTSIGPMKVLLLTTTGRRSGKKRTKPLGYVEDGNDYILAASNAGNDFFPSWWLNLKADPSAEIQVGRKRMKVTARKATPNERERMWPRFVAAYQGYAGYEGKTHREIPVVILSPKP